MNGRKPAGVADRATPAGRGKRIAPAAVIALGLSACLSLSMSTAAAQRKPDLKVTAITAEADATPGDSLAVNDTTKNVGRRTAKPSATGFFLSTDPVMGPSDTQLDGTRPVPRLRKGKSSKGSSQPGVPESVEPGTYNLIACADVSDQVSEKREGNNCRAASQPVTILDVVAPDAPQLDDAPPTANDNEPVITGNAEPGSTVALYVEADCGGGIGDTTTADSSGEFSFTPSVPDDSTTDFSVIATDGSGNSSDCSNSVTYVEDSTTPGAPTGLVTQPNSPANDNAPRVLGNAADGSTVTLYESNDCSGFAAGAGQASGGTFDIETNVTDDSSTNFSATAADAAGNVSGCSSPVTYVEDSSPPAAPTNLSTSPASPADNESPHVQGGAEQGSTVTVYKSADCTGPTAGTGQASGGTFDIEVSVPDDSTTDFSATATDQAGNTGACSASITYVEENVLGEVEPNGSAETATPHPGDGSQISGSIQPVGDQDYFAVVVRQGGSSIVAETFGPDGVTCFGIDTVLRLFAPNGSTELDQDDEGGVSSCSKIDGAGPDVAASNLAPGTYYVRVEDFNNNTTIASYRLRIQVQGPPNEVEPNDGFGTATPLQGSPGRAAGAIDPIGDQDWYSVTVPAGVSITLETFDGSGITCEPSSNHDTFLQLFAPDGSTPLAADDDDGPNTCSRIAPNTDPGASELAAGTYYVRVTELGNNGVVPDYQLMVSYAFSGISEIEPNATTSEAEARAAARPSLLIDSDKRIIGAIDPLGDTDVFKVSPGGGVARFETLGSTGLDCDAGVTTTLGLLNALGTQVNVDNASGLRSCSAITTEIPAGTSYLRVNENGNNATIPGYQLRSEFLTDGGIETEPNDSIETANPVSGSQVYVAGTHSAAADLDVFALTVPAGGSLRLETIETSSGSGSFETCESNGVDSRIRVLTSTGNQLATDDDDGRGFCSMVDGRGSAPQDAALRDLAAGTYYVEVTSSTSASTSGALFDYRLAISIE